MTQHVQVINASFVVEYRGPKGGRMETVGQRIEAARRRRVMTQSELARDAGVAVITITRLEGDKIGNPRPDTVRKLARVLDVDPAWLLFGDEDLKRAA
jgi:transcriptional regulator with XRE-family HTH domain